MQNQSRDVYLHSFNLLVLYVFPVLWWLFVIKADVILLMNTFIRRTHLCCLMRV